MIDEIVPKVPGGYSPLPTKVIVGVEAAELAHERDETGRRSPKFSWAGLSDSRRHPAHQVVDRPP
ncbi:hypothetical protein [Streptomyces sp. NPDC051642]|uniref:hypothetical protein n=1 Tax=unclassified Streptomyces TaxID=2593676 RepID=UPI00341D83BC